MIKYSKYFFSLITLILLNFCLQAYPEFFKPPQKKKLSTMILADLIHINNKNFRLKNELQGKEGLLFTFVILNNANNEESLFTIKEFKDFKINGQSYQQMTKQAIGINIEPQSIAVNLKDIIKQNRIFMDFTPYKEAKNAAFTTKIFGIKLPENGEISFEVEAGWDKETENFTFTCTMDEIRKRTVRRLKITAAFFFKIGEEEYKKNKFPEAKQFYEKALNLFKIYPEKFHTPIQTLEMRLAALPYKIAEFNDSKK